MSNLDLFGWDIVYGQTFRAINTQLATLELPPAQATNDDASLNGAWASWTLDPTSPTDALKLACTLASGTLTLEDAEVDLGGATFVVELRLALAESGTAADGVTWAPGPVPVDAAGDLVVLESTSGVTVSGNANYTLSALVVAALNGTITAITPAFPSIVFGATASEPALQWTMPTGGAVASQGLGTDDPRGGIFAFVTVTSDRPFDALERNVDTRILTLSPDGTDSAIALSQALCTEQFLSPAALDMVSAAQPSDFTVANNGITVTNTAAMPLGTFQYGDAGTISPNIPANNLQLTIDGDAVHLSISGMAYADPSWDLPGSMNVSVDTQMFVSLSFETRDDGGVVLVPTLPAARSYSAIVQASEGALIFDIALRAVTDVVLAVVGGIIGGAIAEGTSAIAESLVAESVSEDVSAMAVDELTPLLEQQAPEIIVEQSEVDAVEAAADVAAAPSKVPKYAGAISKLAFNVVYGFVTAIFVKMPEGKLVDYGVAVAQGNLDNLPSIDGFTEIAFEPIKIPGTDDTWTPTGGIMADALVLWGNPG